MYLSCNKPFVPTWCHRERGGHIDDHGWVAQPQIVSLLRRDSAHQLGYNFLAGSLYKSSRCFDCHWGFLLEDHPLHRHATYTFLDINIVTQFFYPPYYFTIWWVLYISCCIRNCKTFGNIVRDWRGAKIGGLRYV